MPTIGNLSEIITFQSEIRTPDTAGGASVAWNNLATVCAQVTPLSSAEKWRNGQQMNEQAYRFTIRTRSDVSTATRLQWEGVTYNITAVLLHNNSAQYQDIIATAGGAS